jgi:hypothetical protein
LAAKVPEVPPLPAMGVWLVTSGKNQRYHDDLSPIIVSPNDGSWTFPPLDLPSLGKMPNLDDVSLHDVYRPCDIYRRWVTITAARRHLGFPGFSAGQPENPNFANNPTHRPHQKCLYCPNLTYPIIVSCSPPVRDGSYGNASSEAHVRR